MSSRPKLTLSSSVPPRDAAWEDAASSSLPPSAVPPGSVPPPSLELAESIPPPPLAFEEDEEAGPGSFEPLSVQPASAPEAPISAEPISIEPDAELDSDDEDEVVPASIDPASVRPSRGSVVPRMPSVAPPPPDRAGPTVERRAREPQSLVAHFVEFPSLSKEQRRVAFRQILAELGRSALDDGPSPLEGIRAETLTRAVVVATEDGLFDDLDWLSLGQGGAALCHLAATLPAGNEQRDLGRRGLSRLLTADANAFATIATQLARGGGRAFFAPAVAARVALLFEMPLALDLNDATLAFTIASRRLLATRFVTEPSTRSLPERRLAARILERATRLAVQRAENGDRSGLRLVGPEGPLGAVWQRLLADREPLVWRHVAIARGLLVAPTPEGVKELRARFASNLTPTEWRRASVMLGGFALRDGPLALDLALEMFEAGLLERDSGAASGFVFSLGRVAVGEPELARELFDLANPKNPADLAEGVISLARELGECPFLEYARRAALARLSSMRAGPDDDGLAVLRRELAPEEEEERARGSLTRQSEEALAIFHRVGAAGALTAGHKILDAARSALDTLTAVGSDEEESALARRTSFGVLRDLDLGFLERDVIANLMRLDTREARVKSAEEVVEHLRDRLFKWLVDKALRPHAQGLTTRSSGEHALPIKFDHVAVHLGRVRAFLHLVDGDALGRSEEGDRLTVDRVRRALRALALVFESGPPGPLRRAMLAAFARCLDALVRAGTCDVSDALLVALKTLRDGRDLEALAEAAMDPDVARLLVAASALWGKKPPRPGGSIPVTIDSVPVPDDASQRGSLLALDALADVLADVGTARSDGLRAILLKLHHALGLLSTSKSLRSLSGHSGSTMLATLEAATFALTQLSAGAEARVFDEVTRVPSRAPSNALSSLVEGALRRETAVDLGATRTPATALSDGLASWFVTMLHEELRALERLPLDAPAEEAPKEHAPIELPPWIPARRTLGAFWVERPLAEGGVGSVFVVTRTEDRFDARAERFALKVPDYNANAARHLSEAEFLSMFRAEASALVSLPQHDGLARFVTFDLAARPKPILVMELVEGPNLERLIDTRALSWEGAVATIHQVASGLAAMHHAGVGHLDLKPANVVIRRSAQAVLVDFGLAGRSIRPGCGSAPYAAPEVWNHDGSSPGSPCAADMYSLGCLVFETLTGEVLFDGDNELNVIAKHLAHDGFPEKLRSLASQPKHAPLAELLFSVLRRTPADRMAIDEFDRTLKKLMGRYQARDWPLRLLQR